MTPEHGSKSEENCNLRAAKAGHSSNICLSSPNASVLHKYYLGGLCKCSDMLLAGWQYPRS